MTTSTEVGKPCAAYLENADAWAMIHALRGGTQAMRKAGEKYLPRNPQERPTDYEARLGRAFLFPAYRRTVEIMVGKVFATPCEPGEEVPEEFAAYLKDVDLQGRDLHAFAGDLFEAAIDDGVAHILVDMPDAPPARNAAEERAARIRPYWTLVRATSVIGWRTKSTNGGAPELDQLRILEQTTEPDGEFGEKIVSRVRVYFADGSWQLWRLLEKSTGKASTYELEKAGRLSIGVIPIVTLYARREGFMIASPLLSDVAWLNVEHWQKSADQNHILHVARVPILFGKGLPDAITVSPNSFVRSDSENADLRYVEHTGAAIGAGKEDLDSLVDRMAAFGAGMLVKRPDPANSTATGKAITESGENSVLGNLARSLKMTLEAALGLMGKWRGVEEVGGIDLDTQLGVTLAQAADLDVLLRARIAGEISSETFFAEMQRREVVDPTIDFADERDRIEKEGPPAGGLGGLGDARDPDATQGDEDDPDDPDSGAPGRQL